MAKVGLLLRGARGKLAGMVLQKGEKATIAREDVKAANPQTLKQMVQRISFATVSQAAKFMLGVVGQTFEGMPNEKMNRRAFMKANIEHLKSNIIAMNNLFGSTMTVRDASALVPKGFQFLVPNDYVLSKGSIVQPGFLTLTIANAQFNSPVDATGSIQVSAGDVINPATLLELLGLHVGDQITACGILTKNGTTEQVAFPNQEGDYLRYGQFVAKRLVIDSDEDWFAEKSVEVTEGMTVQALEDALTTALRAIVDKDKSDAVFENLFFSNVLQHITISTEDEKYNISFDGVEMALALSGGLLNSDTVNWSLVAAGFFVSNYNGNQWRYSNSSLAVIAPGAIRDDNAYRGGRWRNVLPTYMKGANDATSLLFTRRGGDENSI